LGEVTEEYVTKLLDRHGQQHSAEYWEELAEELSQRSRRRRE
jgi:ribosomal protein L18E